MRRKKKGVRGRRRKTRGGDFGKRIEREKKVDKGKYRGREKSGGTEEVKNKKKKREREVSGKKKVVRLKNRVKY